MNNKTLTYIAYNLKSTIGLYLNKPFPEKESQVFPKKIGIYTYVKNFKKNGSYQEYSFAIYENSQGEKAIAKIWTGRFADYYYHALKNEVVLSKIVQKIRYIYMKKSSTYKKLSFQKVIFAKKFKSKYIVLFEYVDGHGLSRSSNVQKVEVIKMYIKLFKQISVYFKKKDTDKLRVLPARLYVFTFTFFFLKAFLLNPSLALNLLQALKIFLSSISSLWRNNDLTLAHRDMNFNNFIGTKNGYRIIDLAHASVTVPYTDLLQRISFSIDNNKLFNEYISIVKVDIKRGLLSELYCKGLIIYILVQSISFKNVPLKHRKKLIQALKFFTDKNNTHIFRSNNLRVKTRPVNINSKKVEKYFNYVLYYFREFIIKNKHSNVLLPKYLDSLELIKNMQVSKQYPFATGLYKDKSQKNLKVVVKMWQGNIKDIHYYNLLREACVYLVLHTIDNNRENLIQNRGQYKISVPKFVKVTQSENSLFLITKYVPGVSLFKIQNKQNLNTIYKSCLHYLHEILARASKEEIQLLQPMSASSYIVKFPFILTIALLKNPEMITNTYTIVSTFVKGMSKFDKNSLSIVHGDLHPDNIIINSKNINIIDFEQTIVTHSLYEYICTLSSTRANGYFKKVVAEQIKQLIYKNKEISYLLKSFFIYGSIYNMTESSSKKNKSLYLTNLFYIK